MKQEDWMLYSRYPSMTQYCSSAKTWTEDRSKVSFVEAGSSVAFPMRISMQIRRKTCIILKSIPCRGVIIMWMTSNAPHVDQDPLLVPWPSYSNFKLTYLINLDDGLAVIQNHWKFYAHTNQIMLSSLELALKGMLLLTRSYDLT